MMSMQIKRFFLFLTTLFLLPTFQQAEGSLNNQGIIITIPEKVIATSVDAIMPMQIDGVSDQLEGKITIVKVSHFKIHKGKITCHIDLRGDNLNLVTTVANQVLRLKLGTANVDFDCTAELRFDPQRQLLYIRPVAEGIQADEALKQGDIGKALLLFLDGREFPLEMKKMQPFVGDAGSKMITIQTELQDIRAIPGALQLNLIPRVRATNKKG